MKFQVHFSLLFIIVFCSSYITVNAQIIPNGLYQIYSETHGVAIESPSDVNQNDSGDSTINNLFGTPSNLSNNYQQFEFIHQGSDVYKIRNVGTNQYIGIKDNWCGNGGEVIARYSETDSNVEFSVSQDATTGQFIIQIAFTTCNFGSVNSPARSFDLGSATGKVRTFGDTGFNQQFRLRALSPAISDGNYFIFSETNNQALSSPTDVNQDDSSNSTINNLFTANFDSSDNYQKFEFVYQYTNQLGHIYKIKNIGTNLYVGLKDNFCGDFAEVISKYTENDNNVEIAISQDDASGRYLFRKSDNGNGCSYFDLAGGGSGAKIRTFNDTGANQQFRVIPEATHVFDGSWEPSVPIGNEDIYILNNTYSIINNLNLNSILVSNNANIIVSPSSTITVSNTIDNYGGFTFQSDANSSAQLNSFFGTISGDFKVERFIPAGDNNSRAFRFLSPAVNTSNSIKMNWQEGVNNPNSSTNLNPNPGYGTHISGSSSGANGFDATLSGNPSLFTFNNSTQLWSPIDNTDTNTLEAGNAYRLFIRGDRSINLTNNNSTPTNTTIRSTGNLVTGSLTTGQELPALAQGDAEFSFIGNPYQSIVNFASLDFIGDVNPSFLYIWNANAATQGAYETIGLLDSPLQILMPGQGFFVVNSVSVTAPPAIEFNENDKQPGGIPPIINPESESNPIAKANLELYDNNGIMVDVMKFRFEPGAENGINDYDAPKFGNLTENLASVNNNTLLSIERRNVPSGLEIVPLFINQYQTDQYEFRLDISNWDDSIEVFIVDSYLNTETLIDANQVYSFSLDANIPESGASNRFSLSFENTTLSIDEADFGESFSLYPNPTENGVYTIKTEDINAQNVDVKMHNILGQQVFRHSTQVESNGEVRVDASHLSSGVYMVQLTQNESNFNAKLIIK